jgi:hypothetical protein
MAGGFTLAASAYEFVAGQTFYHFPLHLFSVLRLYLYYTPSVKPLVQFSLRDIVTHMELKVISSPRAEEHMIL